MDGDFLHSLLEGVPMPILIVDRDDRIFATNTAAKKLFGEELPGRPLVAFFRQPALLDCVEATLQRGTPAQTGVSVRGMGRASSYQVRTAPLVLAQGRAVMVSFEDMTAMEHAEAMRRDFLANVSHELRTPLTALIGFIETLKGAARDDAEARARFLDIMAREAGRMNRLVSDLLHLSRVEANERSRPTTLVDVAGLVRSSLAVLRPAAEAAGVELTMTGAKDVPPLRADADQITQVFTNLVENAIKYAGAGRPVAVNVALLDHDPVLRGPAVRFDVIDHGEGIPPEHLPRLAERFYRVDTHRSRERGGTGLGLAIVKHIVNRHRGRFKVESTVGKGSTFSVILLRD